MKHSEFTTKLAERFKEKFERVDRCKVEDLARGRIHVSTLWLDTWEFGITKYQAERTVCDFCLEHKLDASKVRFSLTNGHLLVQQRSDLNSFDKEVLSNRSLWKRLTK